MTMRPLVELVAEDPAGAPVLVELSQPAGDEDDDDRPMIFG